MKLLMIKKKEGTPWFLKRRSGCVYIHADAAAASLTRGAGAICHMDTRCAAVLLHRRRTRGAGVSYDMGTRRAAVLLFRDPMRADYSRRVRVTSVVDYKLV